MSELVKSPVFGLLISLIAFQAGAYVKKKLKLSVFNPLLIAIILVILFLTLTNISYEDYNYGGRMISFFLYPATVSLALPLYRKFHLFRKNVLPICAGILCGAVSSIACTIFLARLFGLSEKLTLSLIPKSITTPIGMAVSEQMGGVPPVTVVAIIITGILGSITGPFLYRVLKINDKVAMGIAMGSSSHAIGTAKAVEIGETEGAMSGLTMAIAGIATVFLAPAMWKLYLIIFQ